MSNGVTITNKPLEVEIKDKPDYDREIQQFLEAMRKARDRAYAPMRIWMTTDGKNADYQYIPKPVVGSPADAEGRRKLIEAARHELDKWEGRLR